IGYSLYADVLKGGRIYDLGCLDWFSTCYVMKHSGLYIGVGAVQTSGGTFDYLRSLHIGPEIDISRNLSFAFTLVMHKQTVLERVNGLGVGSPIPASGIPTTTQYGRGIGLMFNFTSEFFEFAEHAA